MINSSSQLAGVYTDYSGLHNLRREAGENNQSAQQEVGQQFEAMFLQMMLKSMRAAGGKGILDTAQTEMVRDMYDQQLAVHLSQQGAIGIADLVMRQIGIEPDDQSNASNLEQGLEKQFQLGQYQNNPLPVVPQQPVLPAESGAIRAETLTPQVQPQAKFNWESITNTDAITFALQQQRPATPKFEQPINPQSWDSPAAFINSLTPAAKAAADRLGTEPEAILAIAALETGWGKHVAKTADGRSGNNLFGIKADRRWRGERTIASTLEFEQGAMQRKREPFRTYASAAESVADFANFILENPRYKPALAVASQPERFLEEIHKAGYATDPAYSKKVTSVMSKVQQITQEPWLLADNR